MSSINNPLFSACVIEVLLIIGVVFGNDHEVRFAIDRFGQFVIRFDANK
jgi:hypothetical protein